MGRDYNKTKCTRLWWFTQFDLEFDYQKCIDETCATYIAYAEEECPTTGRKHHQGWVYWADARRSFKGCNKDLGKAKCGPCDGTLQQNDDYCSKEGSLVTFGVKPQQGKRTDLLELTEDIMSRKRTVDQITVEQPMAYHQYGRTLTRLEDIALRKRFRTEMTKGLWLWGKTGVGKSHRAFEGFSPDTHYVFPNDGGWWDGYAGQETVIFNEFRGGIAFGEMLDLVDKWPKTVARRGREPAPFLAKQIIVTSSMSPQEVYSGVCNSHERLDQLLRRFTVERLTQK